MRASAWMMAAALAALATAAAAETRVVPTVLIASANWAKAPNTVTINATVQLNDSCWSNPRFLPPLASAKPAAGQIAPIEVVADYATGKMCAQVVRKVAVPTLNWRIYPNPKLTGVKIVGSAQPVTVVIGRLAGTPHGVIPSGPTIPGVVSGSAVQKTADVIVLTARMEFSDDCWSNPRFGTPKLNGKTTLPIPDAQVVIVASHAGGNRPCQLGNVFLDVPALNWTTPSGSKIRSIAMNFGNSFKTVKVTAPTLSLPHHQR